MAVNHPLLLCIMVMLTPVTGGGQTAYQPAAARYLGMSAYSVSFADIHGAHTNPASLRHLSSSVIGVYSERRFLLQNLNYHMVNAGIKTNDGGFGLLGSYFGFAQQYSTRMSLAYGRSINAKLDAGASLQWHQLSQAGFYGGTSGVGGSFGLLFHPTPEVHAGISVINPFGASWRKSAMEPIPARYHFGLGWDASEQNHFSLEMVKEDGQSLNVNAGFIYRIIPGCTLRGGIATQTSSYFFGFGFQTGHLRTDLAFSYHPTLGWSPGFLLLWNLKKHDQNAAVNAGGGNE